MTIEEFIRTATTGNHCNDPKYIMACNDAYELAQEIRDLLAELKEARKQAFLEITEGEIVKACQEAGFNDGQWKAMTYDKMPYDLTCPTFELKRLAQILMTRASRELRSKAEEEE